MYDQISRNIFQNQKPKIQNDSCNIALICTIVTCKQNCEKFFAFPQKTDCILMILANSFFLSTTYILKWSCFFARRTSASKNGQKTMKVITAVNLKAFKIESRLSLNIYP